VTDENDDDVLDQLKDLEYEPTIVDGGIDFDEWELLSWEPGDDGPLLMLVY
jgi:hypothetical protein